MIWKLEHDKLSIGYIEEHIDDSKFNLIWSDFQNWKGSHVEFYYKTFKPLTKLK